MEYNQTEKTLEFTEIYQSIDEFLQNTNEFNNNEHINMLEFLNDMKSIISNHHVKALNTASAIGLYISSRYLVRKRSQLKMLLVTDGVMGEVFMSNQNRFKT
ncbi:hypothetical protein CWI38_0063p0010 [Hamiltosporidium tvaerminnensis]|uniref:Uncharacterized protein n=1 Tax=Hamiltosporidium tvaerminnensis TaxID=1176355 RepID=A0A4Q9M1G7_9MICR|nr:hypothetical protein CWI38_0063p0010 [Hamiltosporidium tvaerminnensis]